MKGEIEVFAPFLLSVLFPGNGILHGGKRQKVCFSAKRWGKPSQEFLIILSSSSVKIGTLLYAQPYCYEIQQTANIMFFKDNGVKPEEGGHDVTS